MLGRPRNPAQDLADFRGGVEIRVKSLFSTPDGRVKAKWGELRLSTEPDARWASKIGQDTLAFTLATTTIALSAKQHFKRTRRFDLTSADGTVRTMTVFTPDAELVNAAFRAVAVPSPEIH
jgi:hypothetical protein